MYTAYARAGALPIEIQNGEVRSKKSLEKTLCMQCNMAIIDNMSHSMFMCPKTNTIWERFNDYVTIIIRNVKINVTDDEKITLYFVINN